MGQKTHPIGFRLGGVANWQAHWFAGKAADYRRLVGEDLSIRATINRRYGDSGAISRVDIERGPQDLVIAINTARPGIVIGRGGQRVDELRADLEKLTGKRARLNIQEIRQPELDAYLVARNVAEQLERRVAYRRALRQSLQRTMQTGALGVKIVVSGRLGGSEIARTDKAMEGRIPLHTLRANIDFAIAEAHTSFGQIGVKVWIYKGDTVGFLTEAPAQPAAGAFANKGGRGRGRRERARPADAVAEPGAPTPQDSAPAASPSGPAAKAPVAASAGEPAVSSAGSDGATTAQSAPEKPAPASRARRSPKPAADELKATTEDKNEDKD